MSILRTSLWASPTPYQSLVFQRQLAKFRPKIVDDQYLTWIHTYKLSILLRCHTSYCRRIIVFLFSQWTVAMIRAKTERSDAPTSQKLRGRPLLASSLASSSQKPVHWLGAVDLSVFERPDAPTFQFLRGRTLRPLKNCRAGSQLKTHCNFRL